MEWSNGSSVILWRFQKLECWGSSCWRCPSHLSLKCVHKISLTSRFSAIGFRQFYGSLFLCSVLLVLCFFYLVVWWFPADLRFCWTSAYSGIGYFVLWWCWCRIPWLGWPFVFHFARWLLRWLVSYWSRFLTNFSLFFGLRFLVVHHRCSGVLIPGAFSVYLSILASMYFSNRLSQAFMVLEFHVPDFELKSSMRMVWNRPKRSVFGHILLCLSRAGGFRLLEICGH